jgi:hypothetical protein
MILWLHRSSVQRSIHPTTSVTISVASPNHTKNLAFHRSFHQPSSNHPQRPQLLQHPSSPKDNNNVYQVDHQSPPQTTNPDP